MPKIKMRRRDFAAPAPAKPEVVRVEKLVAPAPPADLSPLEAQLRANSKEIRELRTLISGLQGKSAAPENYRFMVHRGPDRLIEYVDGIVVDENIGNSLLEKASGSLH